jgi:hypothetical protein
MEFHSAECLRQVMTIPGALGATLVDHATGLTLGTTGRAPADDSGVTGSGLTALVDAALGGAPFTPAGAVGRLDNIAVTAGNGYHLVHLLPGRPDTLLVLYVWLDRVRGNLAIAQRRIRSLSTEPAS